MPARRKSHRGPKKGTKHSHHKRGKAHGLYGYKHTAAHNANISKALRGRRRKHRGGAKRGRKKLVHKKRHYPKGTTRTRKSKGGFIWNRKWAK